ncbi:MAG: hypothetical protein J5998_06720 [Clostridia bacterium]|nr:hypothetical protein [Clostridia bacterium]
MPQKPQKKKRPPFEKYMIRPVVYQVFTRFLVCLCLALLWNRFVAPRVAAANASWGFAFFVVFFAAMAWLAYLRLDGVSVPKFDRRLFRRKKTPERAFGDMIDYVDEPVVTYEELSDEEKDLTLLISNLITMLLFIAASLL